MVTGGMAILDMEEEVGKRDGITVDAVLGLQELEKLEEDEETTIVDGGSGETWMVGGRGEERVVRSEE